MSPEAWQRVLELFNAALEHPAAERDAFLCHNGSGEPELLCEVRSLLASYEEAPDFLEDTAFNLPAPDDAAEGLPIGPYRVLRRIGDGGMGTVVLAERADEQFHMRVALKLVKPGMDSEEILRRFRAERQILASLEHPNIARLLDGGLTEDGRPYLVMEHVEDAVPIDEHCDRNKLPLAERLRLFRTVCGAVQHAHQNLVAGRGQDPRGRGAAQGPAAPGAPGHRAGAGCARGVPRRPAAGARRREPEMSGEAQLPR